MTTYEQRIREAIRKDIEANSEYTALETEIKAMREELDKKYDRQQELSAVTRHGSNLMTVIREIMNEESK